MQYALGANVPRKKIREMKAETLKWRRIIHWNFIYGWSSGPINRLRRERNRECKSRARRRSQRVISRLISIRDASRTYHGHRETKRTEEERICATKVSITSRGTLLHLRLFSTPRNVSSPTPRSARRQAPFRHRRCNT